jgi:hypothetical protein
MPSAVTGWVSQMAMDLANSGGVTVPEVIAGFPLLVMFISCPVSFAGLD